MFWDSQVFIKSSYREVWYYMLQKIINNRYKIVQVLAEGGFGKTFLAEDTHLPSGRRCVIKLLKPVTNNSQIYKIVQDRFQREAAILEDLGNSNNQIPKLYAYFTEQDNFYLVQEYIEGKTLTHKVQTEGVMSESAVREILKNLLYVLNFVHSRHIVHRDIKPDNVIFRNSDDVPVLIDFGAVRELMGTVMNSQGSPTNSIIIGTPGFMPPEQADGRAVYSSDLYSLALTIIYLLTGRMPQELQTDPITGGFIWHQYAMNVSSSLQMVLDKAIAYHPDFRYATAREMIDALQSLEKSGVAPTVLPLASPNPATQPLKKKHNFPPILYILLFFLMGGTYWLWTTYKPSTNSTEFEQKRISSGDKNLVTADATPQKQAGVKALASGDSKTAITQFSSSLPQHRNDPETLMYRNNALILEKLVTANVNPANIKLSQNLEKVKLLKTQSLTLAQALELAQRNPANPQSSSEEIRLTVSLEYYDMQQADEQVRLAQSAVTNAQATLRDAQAQEKAGVSTRFEVLHAQMNLKFAKQTLTNALLQQQIERSQLAFQLGLPYSISVSPAEPVKLAGLWDKTLEQSIALTLQNKNEQQLQRNQKSLQIEETYGCMQVNLENIQTMTAAVELAREALRLARLRFQAGVGTQTEVIVSANMLIISEANQVESILDYNRALAHLQRDVSSSEITPSNPQYELHKEKDKNCSYAKRAIAIPNSP